MTGRQRILATLRHEEPDRVPIAPRVWAWLMAEHGAQDLGTHLRAFPDLDQMYPVEDGTLNLLDVFPEHYDLPGVRVEQRKSQQGDFVAVERTFHTPTGKLSDRILVPPNGREFGVTPNPVRTEHLVKGPDDLAALRYILAPVNTRYDFLADLRRQMGERGVVMVVVRCALDHNAGHARDVADLMVDYYDNRPFFDELIDLFHRRSMAQIKAALEGGAEFIFGTWYFASLSAGWSPAIFAEVFVPLIREHVELTHRYGACYDYYDDGRLDASMELADLHVAQPVKAGADPRRRPGKSHLRRRIVHHIGRNLLESVKLVDLLERERRRRRDSDAPHDAKFVRPLRRDDEKHHHEKNEAEEDVSEHGQ